MATEYQFNGYVAVYGEPVDMEWEYPVFRSYHRLPDGSIRNERWCCRAHETSFLSWSDVSPQAARENAQRCDRRREYAPYIHHQVTIV